MIIDHIRNRKKYYFLGNEYKLALDFFAEEAEKTLEKGEVQLKGDDVVVKKCIMQTKYEKDSKFEAHRRFADIHFVVYGVERIGYADVDLLEITDSATARSSLVVIFTFSAPHSTRRTG